MLRKVLAGFGFVFLMGLGAEEARGQIPGPTLTTCVAHSTAPIVQAEGIAEVIGDIILICQNATQTIPLTATAQQDVSLSLNTPVANTAGSGSLTDARLIVNENHCGTAASTGGVFGSCGAPDPRFQDPQNGVLAANNRLEWLGVVFPIPNAIVGGTQYPAVTTIRITGVKANVFTLGGAAAPPNVQVTGFISLTGVKVIPVTNNVLNLAKPISGAPSNQQSPDPAYGLTTCQATAVPPVIRAEGISELTGDIVLACTNYYPPGDPAMSSAPMKMTVTLNTNVTNNVGGPFADAILIVNENNCTTPAGKGSRFTCGSDLRFQDPQYAKKFADDRLEWSDVAFPIPGAFPPAGGQFPLTSTVRITGIKANPTQFGIPVSTTFPVTQVGATLTFSGPATVSPHEQCAQHCCADPGLAVDCAATARRAPVRGQVPGCQSEHRRGFRDGLEDDRWADLRSGEQSVGIELLPAAVEQRRRSDAGYSDHRAVLEGPGPGSS